MFGVLLALFLGETARSKTVLDAFDPNVNGGLAAMVLQPDGKIIIGGGFTYISPNGGTPLRRNGIARLNADGSVDPDFDPNANNTVYALALQPDGKILVAGAFDNIGGQNRDHLARLDAVTGEADSFDPKPIGSIPLMNPRIVSIVVQPDGKILLGGDFSLLSPKSVRRDFIARVEATGELDSEFDAQANGAVSTIVLDHEGRILVGGYFPNMGGQFRSNFARLDSGKGHPDPLDPLPNGRVCTIAVQPDGKILVGGYFSFIGGQGRNQIARIDPDTGLADSFNPTANSDEVESIVIQADGKILAGGFFNSIGGQIRSGVAQLDSVTGIADDFDPHPYNSNNPAVYVLAQQTDGKILVAGAFTTVAPDNGSIVVRNRIARFDGGGLPSSSPSPTPTATATATPTLSATPTSTPTPTPASSPTPTASATATPPSTARARPTATPSPTATATPTASPNRRAPTATPSPSATPLSILGNISTSLRGKQATTY